MSGKLLLLLMPRQSRDYQVSWLNLLLLNLSHNNSNSNSPYLDPSLNLNLNLNVIQTICEVTHKVTRLLNIKNRNSKLNFKWPFMQKWQCSIHNGTLETSDQ